MAFRPLTEAECGQANPLSRLTSHITHDHTFSESHGQVFQSSSDQLVEQFLQESRAVPQTFRMDDLMREMHEIESQRSALPPIPASTVKDQLHDNSWALQYIEDGKRFNVRIVLFIPNILSREHFCTKSVEAQEWTNEYFRTEGKGDETDKLKSIAADWANEHLRSKEEEFNSSFWDQLQEEMKKVSNSDTDSTQPWIDEFNSYYNTPQKEYEFSEDNPMLDVIKPLERGKQFLEEGDFPSAVLCFEAAAKKEPENVEAWLLLGTTQAENEQDPVAIAALNRCLQLDPTNLNALMALAISYTNESYYNQACQMLLNWLKNNTKYNDLVPPNLTLSGQVTSLLVPDDHKIVQELFIKAAQRHPQDVDYEVQCGLGVLFNLTGEHTKAADCFSAGLSVRPDDARLWNRLGATLANGSKPEEAVDAYHHALNISPGFIRARYNVGITCINLNAYREAAEHFLIALNQQARGKDVSNSGSVSQMSDTIWTTLRMCISLMNRGELKSAVDKRDLKELNKAFFID
nr:peroxisomal targeting signal 1 receptor [Leptinotarsa decemlineata]